MGYNYRIKLIGLGEVQDIGDIECDLPSGEYGALPLLRGGAI